MQDKKGSAINLNDALMAPTLFDSKVGVIGEGSGCRTTFPMQFSILGNKPELYSVHLSFTGEYRLVVAHGGLLSVKQPDKITPPVQL